MSFLEISFPMNFEYSSDEHPIPLEFYLDILPRSKIIYLKLGYFSSKAIQVLAYGFAQFIYHGGTIKIISNHFLYERDQELLVNIEEGPTNPPNSYILKDMEWLHSTLNGPTQHFMDCLKLLSKLGRLELIPVKLKPGKMVHYKQGVFVDQESNVVFMDGSCNFTARGLLENAENITVFRSWGGTYEKEKVKTKSKSIEKIAYKLSDKYIYLDKKELQDAIDEIGRDKEIEELLNDELVLIDAEGQKTIKSVLDKHKINLEIKIEAIKNNPKFPFLSGPRDYQNVAYRKWIENHCQGIFAMATGTGKTITALNCLLNDFYNTGAYKAIVLVPSKALLDQWFEEINRFNFKKIILVSSEYKWRPQLDALNTSMSFDRAQSFVIVTTYLTFASDDFQNKTCNLPPDTLLIADEAHNMGSERLKALLPTIRYSRRIGLSATPKRRFDDEGNALIEAFFSSREPYTYSFSMEKAIRENILSSYYYFPHVVHLNEDEMDEYAEISKKLARLFDSESKGFTNPDVAKMLLLKRKQIIHKAANKLQEFEKIVLKIMSERRNLRFSFVYVPEGVNEEGENILDAYMQSLARLFPSVKAYHYTSNSDNRREIMRNFELGFVDTLFSMKCLDEGVDIPRAELAIFCSSTGNPRQFIQRRGRVLRKHPDKEFSVIHDLVVVPTTATISEFYEMERSLIREELVRVVYFASLSRNYYEAMTSLESISDHFQLNIFALQHELEE